MILYNVTITLEERIEDDWVQWMREQHIPDVLNTGLFKDHNFLKMVSHPPEEGTTYIIQYFLEDQTVLDRYQKEYAAELQNEHNERYKGKFVAFRTIMESV